MTEDERMTKFAAMLMRKQFYVPQRGQLLYQYTDIAALCNGILGEGREEGKEIRLWASSLAYMNDPAELETGVAVAVKLFKDEFDIDLRVKQGIIEKVQNDTYVTSLTPNVDCLPMWNMYGNNGHGVALGFDSTILTKSANVRLFKCLYNTTSTIRSFIKKWKNDEPDKIEKFLMKELSIDISDYPLYLLLNLMLLSKDKGYSYEKEVRAIMSSKEPVKYRYGRGYIIPYKEYNLPAQALRKIWIGPSIDQETAYRSVRTYLDYLGLNHVQIETSLIPYRTF